MLKVNVKVKCPMQKITQWCSAISQKKEELNHTYLKAWQLTSFMCIKINVSIAGAGHVSVKTRTWIFKNNYILFYEKKLGYHSRYCVCPTSWRIGGFDSRQGWEILSSPKWSDLYGAHPASYVMGTRGSLSRGKEVVACGWPLSTMQYLRMSGAMTCTPPVCLYGVYCYNFPFLTFSCWTSFNSIVWGHVPICDLMTGFRLNGMWRHFDWSVWSTVVGMCLTLFLSHYLFRWRD